MLGKRTIVTTAHDPDHVLALALSHPHEALKLARALCLEPVPPATAAVAHQAAGIVLRDFGDIEEALTEFRTALRYARRAGDEGRGADVRAAYGVALVMAGRQRAGLAQIETAAEHAVGEAAGRIHIRSAHALWVLGRIPEALRAAQRAVALLRGGDPVWEARAYAHRAAAHLALGAVDRAEEDYARSEDLFERAGQRLEYATARHDRGTAAFARGDLPTALALLDDAQRIVDELGVFEPELDVTRVQILLAARLDRDALRVADEAVARSERLRGAATRRGELLLTAALAASASGDHATAVARSTEALRMFRRQERTPWAARAEAVLLASRFASGERSATLQGRSVHLAAVLSDVDSGRAVEAHLLAGRIALARGRRGIAVRELRAAASRRPRDVRARTAAWLARVVLAETENRPHDLLAGCARGLDLVDAHLATLGGTEIRASATAQGSELATVALRHAVRTSDARCLLAWSERLRATVLITPPARLQADSPLTRDLAALRMLTRRLDALGPAAPAPLQHERRRLEDAVRREALRRPGTGGPRIDPFRVEDLRSLLGDTDLVELTDVDGQLFGVILSGDKDPALHLIGPTSAAERAITHALFVLRRGNSRRDETPLDVTPIRDRLQYALLGPVIEAVTSSSVVVVPTGRLHAVPWAFLPDLRDRAVTVVPSAAIWRRALRAVHDPPLSGDRRVVLIGGPGLSSGLTEVRRLAERYPDAVVLADGDATSERVLAAMDGAWLVHVAAHGTFRSDNPLLSALELDDGPLTVYDLERLDRAPHRVVLSSCNSAIGAPSGADELLGVASALMALGSTGVVASVVPIDDPGTVPFMIALHGSLPETPLGAALAAARRAVRDHSASQWVSDSFIALGV